MSRWIRLPGTSSWFNLSHAHELEVHRCGGDLHAPRFEVWAHHGKGRVTVLHSLSVYEEALLWTERLLGLTAQYVECAHCGEPILPGSGHFAICPDTPDFLRGPA